MIKTFARKGSILVLDRHERFRQAEHPLMPDLGLGNELARVPLGQQTDFLDEVLAFLRSWLVTSPKP